MHHGTESSDVKLMYCDSPTWRLRSRHRIKQSRGQLVRLAPGQSTATPPPCAELDLQVKDHTPVV